MRFAETSAALLAKLAPRDLPIVAELVALDEDAAVRAICAQLVSSARRWAALPDEASCVRFHFAGADVEPWIPSEAWANVYGDHAIVDGRFKPRRLLREAIGGFDPIPLSTILVRAANDGDDVDDDVRALFVAKSLELAARALADPQVEVACRDVKMRRPFPFFATPGHGEPTVLLHTLS